jgi:hypothetical protein
VGNVSVMQTTYTSIVTVLGDMKGKLVKTKVTHLGEKAKLHVFSPLSGVEYI